MILHTFALSEILVKMKLRLLLFPLLLGCLTASGQKDIYQSSHFESLSKDHRVLAIIPFFAHLDLDEEMGHDERKRLEEREGYAVQDALETYFGRGTKRKKFSVDFQNSKDTNALLARADITYANIDRFTIPELARILGVDGIISGNLDVNILLSDGIPADFSFLDYLLGEADYGRIGIKISDGATGRLLWKYEQEISRKSGKDTDDMIDKMMKKAARKFPYEKQALQR